MGDVCVRPAGTGARITFQAASADVHIGSQFNVLVIGATLVLQQCLIKMTNFSYDVAQGLNNPSVLT